MNAAPLRLESTAAGPPADPAWRAFWRRVFELDQLRREREALAQNAQPTPDPATTGSHTK